MSLFLAIYRYDWSCTSFSNNQKTTGKTDIGLLFDLSSDGLSLHMGAILANFQLPGKNKESLKISKSDVRNDTSIFS